MSAIVVVGQQVVRALALSCLMLLLNAFAPAQAQALGDLEQQRIRIALPEVTQISEPQGEFAVRSLGDGEKILGYAFQSRDVIDLPAYSGKPINMQILLDPKGVIVDAYVLEHHEPILLVGIPEAKLHDFSAGYKGVGVGQRVVVGHSSDPDAVTIDAITGATVTSAAIRDMLNGVVRDLPRPAEEPAP